MQIIELLREAVRDLSGQRIWIEEIYPLSSLPQAQHTRSALMIGCQDPLGQARLTAFVQSL
jgi:hypothetical protein